MPKVSIISPVYNVEPYLKRCLECLKNQTLEDLEFIFIDDCSTDNSLEILKEYEAKDSRFKVISLAKNSGAAVARNKGLEIATGEYLGFIDPDDAIDLNYYEELYKKAKEKDYDIVKCQRKNITPKKTSVSSLNRAIKRHGLYAFTYEWTTAIYKKSLIDKYNIHFYPEITKAQDVVFLNQIIIHAESYTIIDGIYYYYYKRKDSLNSNVISLEKIQSACNAIIKILENINSSDLFERKIKDYIYLYNKNLFSLFGTLFQNDSEEAKELIIKTLTDCYNKCKSIDLLDKEMKYKKLRKLLKIGNYKVLSASIKTCKNIHELNFRYKDFRYKMPALIDLIKHSVCRKFL